MRVPAVEPQEVVRIYYADRKEMDALARQYDIWEVHHDRGYCVALLTETESRLLHSRGYRIEVDEEKTRLLTTFPETATKQAQGIPGYPSYRTVEETYDSIAVLAARHPRLALVLDIGDSWEKTVAGGDPGYDILALVLTNRATSGPKPVFLLLGETHAREYVSAELALRFGEYLVSQYGADPDVTWLLDFCEVHIIPMHNPDGRKWAEAAYLWRKNTNRSNGCLTFPDYGTDLNRNSSFHWGGASNRPCNSTYQGPFAVSEPETAAVQQYAATLFPDQRGPSDTDPAPDDATGVFLTLHSYGRQVLWPWGWTLTPAPNDVPLRALAHKFAFFNGYQPMRSAALYLTTGTTDDWTYGQLGVASYTFELGTSFFQDCAAFENTIYPANLPALLWAFKNAHRPYRTSLGPDSCNVRPSSAAVTAGRSFLLTATGDHTRYAAGIPAENVVAARYSVDAPSWLTGTVSMETNTGTPGPVQDFRAVVDTTGWQIGRHMVLVESQAFSGAWGVPTAVFVSVRGPVEGDINDDGIADVADVIACMRMTVEEGVWSGWQDYPPPYPAWLLAAADANSDGTVDILDVMASLRRALGK